MGLATGKANKRVTILLDKLSPKAIRLDEVPLQTRAASGKTIVELKSGYQVLGLSVSWVVPRAVAGEKAIPEKELDVVDEPQVLQAPEVEQLTFGMIEPTLPAIPKTVKPKPPKSGETSKQKNLPAARKTKAVKTEQAALITKPVPTKEKAQRSKTARPKSPKGTPTAKEKSKAKSEPGPAKTKAAVNHKKTPLEKTGRQKLPTSSSIGKEKDSLKFAQAPLTNKVAATKKKGQARKTGQAKSPKSSLTRKTKTTARASKASSNAKPATGMVKKSTHQNR